MRTKEVVVYSLIFMFIFSITGNMGSTYMDKSKIAFIALDETNRNLCCTVELSAKDYVNKDDQYISTSAISLLHSPTPLSKRSEESPHAVEGNSTIGKKKSDSRNRAEKRGGFC